MKLKVGMAFLGSLIGLGAAAAVYFGFGISWITLIVIAGVSLAGYLAAAIATPRTSLTRFGEVMRGLLIGFNAGLNGVLAYLLVSAAGAGGEAIAVGIGIGTVNYLAVFAPISQTGAYQGFVGYTCWLMPMSWPIVGLGTAFLIVSFLGALITLFRIDYMRITSMRVDWKTGTIFVQGGFVANLNYLNTAFNMGNYAFVDRNSSSWHIDHEAGHTLNLAAFGSIFHLIGAIDENIIPGRGHMAYAERIAESNDSGSSGANIPMWI